MKKKNSKKYSLSLKILISKDSLFFNENEIILEYLLRQEEDTYLILKKKPKDSNKFLVKSNHYILNKDQDETLIFNINYKDNINSIEFYNPFDECYKCNLKKLYNKQDNLNYQLWKIIPKLHDIDYEDDENNEIILKENDIIRLGRIKIILREINIKGYKIEENTDNNKKVFTAKLREEIENKICSICKKGDLEKSNPLIGLCLCDQDKKYRHYKCIKEKINIKKLENENNGCISYYVNTHCENCGKYIPLNFYVMEKDKIETFYQLIEIPKNKDEDYLLFETFDFKELNNFYVKYFYYVKLGGKDKDKNYENIIIGKAFNDKYECDNFIKIEGDMEISDQHALIEYDKEAKKLSLKNISETQNLYILKDKFILKKTDNLNVEFGNIKIQGKLINNDNIDYNENLEKNIDKIEIREILEK